MPVSTPLGTGNTAVRQVDNLLMGREGGVGAGKERTEVCWSFTRYRAGCKEIYTYYVLFFQKWGHYSHFADQQTETQGNEIAQPKSNK